MDSIKTMQIRGQNVDGLRSWFVGFKAAEKDMAAERSVPSQD